MVNKLSKKDKKNFEELFYAIQDSFDYAIENYPDGFNNIGLEKELKEFEKMKYNLQQKVIEKFTTAVEGGLDSKILDELSDLIG